MQAAADTRAARDRERERHREREYGTGAARYKDEQGGSRMDRDGGREYRTDRDREDGGQRDPRDVREYDRGANDPRDGREGSERPERGFRGRERSRERPGARADAERDRGDRDRGERDRGEREPRERERAERGDRERERERDRSWERPGAGSGGGGAGGGLDREALRSKERERDARDRERRMEGVRPGTAPSASDGAWRLRAGRGGACCIRPGVRVSARGRRKAGGICAVGKPKDNGRATSVLVVHMVPRPPFIDGKRINVPGHAPALASPRPRHHPLPRGQPLSA